MLYDNFIEESFDFLDKTSDQRNIISINSFSETSHLFEIKEKISTNYISNIFPEFYSLSKINQILLKNIKDINLKNSIILTEKEIKDYYLLQGLKKKSLENRLDYDSFNYNFSKEQNIVNENNDKNKKRGRKKQKDEVTDIHTKFSSDNIIKKIKAKFFHYANIFLNNLLNLSGKERLFKIDYNLYINNLKRNRDLGYLYTPLRELFSMKVSKKYISEISNEEERNKEENHNKIILDNVYEKGDETIKFALDMTFINFIDLFICKTTVKDLINQKEFTGLVEANKIKTSISGFENSLKYVMKKNNNDKIYFSNYIFFLYNYERYFFIKRGRNIKKIKNDLGNYYSQLSILMPFLKNNLNFM